MPPDNPWSRLRKGRLVQVLAIYLGASWLVLQIGDTLEDTLGLPDWVLPTAFLLLLVGLVVVVATAWVQSHPLARERAETEEVPHAWELDARDLRGALAQGRLPHLTWPRALFAGASAFLLLSTIAATVMLVARDGNVGSATGASASALPGLAVMPFTVSGDGSEVWREGMVDLLTTNLDGAAGLRTIDTRNVLARWRERFGDGDADAEHALEAARATGARYALLGSATSIGAGVRLSAELFDLESGDRIGGIARVQGARDSVFSLIDAFSVAILREAMRAEGVTSSDELAGVESLTTSSLPALLSFLEGEALYRRAEFRAAIDAYEAAVAADSTFALPYYRLSSAYGWAQGIGARTTKNAAERALEHAGRMTSRDAALVRLAFATGTVGIVDSIAPLRALAHRYPDDPEIWHELGEAIVHLGEREAIPKREAVEAFLRVIELDSTFAPAYIHPIELALADGDMAAARRLLEAYDRFGDDERLERLQGIASLIDGSAPANLLDTIPAAVLGRMRNSMLTMLPDRGDELARVTGAQLRRADTPASDRGFARVLHPFGEILAGRPRAALDETTQVDGGIALYLRRMLLEMGYGEAGAADSIAAGIAERNRADWLIGVIAIEKGETARHESIARALRDSAAALRAPAEGEATRDARLRATSLEALATSLDAYARWKGGDPVSALADLQRAGRRIHGVGFADNGVTDVLRSWSAAILVELGRHAEAAQLFESMRLHGLGLYRAALAWENAGETQRAHAAWARVLRNWRNAEPDFALVAEARAGLERTAPDR